MIRGGDLFDVVKVHPSAECKTIRIAVSAVMDGWKGHRSRRMGNFMFSKEKWFLDGNKEASRGTWEVRIWKKMVGLGETSSLISWKEKGVSPS